MNTIIGKMHLVLTIVLLIQITKAQVFTCEQSDLNSNWINLGPFDDEQSHLARVTALYVDPVNSNKITIGTRGSGMWQTTNGGSNWVNLFSYELPSVGVNEIVEADVFVEGPSYSTTALYGYGYFGSILNRYDLGIVFFDPFNGKWELEPKANYPSGFSFQFNKNELTTCIEYRPDNDEIWVGNREKIYVRNTYSHYTSPTENYYTWNENAVLDYSILDPMSLGVEVWDIDFATGNPNYAVVGPHEGSQSLFVFTNNANSISPTWSSITSMPEIVPAPHEQIFATIISYFVNTSKFYSIIRYKTKDLIENEFTYDNSYLCEYQIIGGIPTMVHYFPIDTYPANEWVDLHVLASNPNKFVVGINQRQLNVGIIPAINGLTIPIEPVTYYPECDKDFSNTHGDIRVVRMKYNSELNTDEIYIGTDGGISFCPIADNLVMGVENDDIWQNLNGDGLSIADFESIETTEMAPYKILGIAGDGNSWIFNDKPEVEEPHPFGSICDAYKAAISNVVPYNGVVSYNGTGWAIGEGFIPITFNTYDMNSGARLNTSRPQVPRGDVSDADEDRGKYMMPLMPFEFKTFNNIEKFYAGTNEVYSNLNAFQSPTDQSNWLKLSEVSIYNLTQVNPLAITGSPISTMASYADPINSAKTHIYFATYKNRSADDLIKMVYCTYLEGDPNPYTAVNITPGHDGGDLPTTNQLDKAFITGLAIDFNNENVNNSEIWVSFGSNTLNEWGAGTHPEALWYVMDETNQSRTGKVYYSPDNGSTWFDKSEGLPNYPVIDLEYWKGSDDVIFAATGVGIYVWNKGLETWECFNTNLPLASAGDIEINYCTKTLRTCLYGYGVWETPLPDIKVESPSAYQPIEIYNDETWQYSQDAYTDIIIKPGATLTVQNCEIRMPKDGKIIVENGGKLVLDGATITNYCDFWDGIEVWGKGNSVPHPALEDVFTGEYPINDSDHGVVFLTNNAKIESAEVAITTYNSAYPTTSTFYGGIIVARYSEFHNNITSIDIRPFDVSPSNTDDDNINEFYMCKFSKDEQMPCDIYASSDVFLDDVDGVLFHACKFENTFSSCTDFNFPIGINSTNATYTVESDCNFAGEEGCEVNETYFSGYYRGVYASNSAARPRAIIIDDVHFINNERSILLSAVTQSEIFRNYFEIPDFSSKTGYGLYLEGCLNYHVEGNYFTSLGTLTSNSHFCSGILVENNHNIATQIYRNTFENIEIGIRSQGNNSKLQLRCNDFISPIHDYNIIVTSGTLGNQGICNATITQPAGNIFSFNGETESDFRIVPSGVTLNYRHHTESDYIPIDYTTTNINLHNCGVSGGDDCVSTLPGGIGGEGRMSTIEATGYQEAIDLELSKIDGGNTEGFIADIQGGVSPTEVKYLLDEASPYISNEVLVTMLAAEPLGTSEILDVMNNNYPISDTVATTLEVSNYNVPSPVIEALNEDIINNHLNVSAMTDLLATVSILETKREYAIMQSFNDLIKESKIDSALSIIDEEAGDWAQQLEIQFLSAASNYIDAEAALSNYTRFDETGENFITLYSVLIGLDSSGRTVSEITEVEESTLRSIANKETPSGIAAQNILDAVFQEKYPEVIDEIPELMVRLADFDINTTNQGFKIYPNPVDNILYIEITNWDEKINYWANIYDMKGIKVATYDLRKDYKLSWIETEKILTGIYLIEVYSGNQILGTQKIIFE